MGMKSFWRLLWDLIAFGLMAFMTINMWFWAFTAKTAAIALMLGLLAVCATAIIGFAVHIYLEHGHRD